MKTTLKKYQYLLVTYFKPLWRLALMLALLLLSSIILRLLNPRIISDFIDAVVGGKPVSVLVKDALWFLLIAILIQILALAEAYFASNMGLLATNRLRADLALHCMKLDLSFHNQHTPGEMIERVDGDVGTLENFFSRFIVEVLGSVILMVGILIMLFSIDWRVGSVFCLFIIITLVFMSRLRDVAVPQYRKARQANADLFGFLEERLSGTEDVRANGAVAYVMRRLYEHSRPVLRAWVKAGITGSVAFGVIWILFAAGSAISLALGAYLFQLGKITIGTVYLIFRYAELLNMPLENISRQFYELQQAGASTIRIMDLLSLKSTVLDTGELELSVGEALRVECQGVSFVYQADGTQSKVKTDDAAPIKPDLDKVLNDISFELPTGTILGLLGRTGSGKTTLTRLLVRFYDPLQGVIRLNGVALPEISLGQLRQRIGLVTQEIQLFSATLRENLTLFDPSIPDERILLAFDELGLRDWYSNLPDGLDTKMEPGGGGLSAGEAQLLAFVRVFLRDPGLIILDEASSRLDPATEARLDRAIERLLHGRTAIIIAHRLGTVQRAGRILILENGCQVEYGERQILADDPDSHFAGLLRTGLQEALA